MSSSSLSILALCLAAFMAGCAPAEEPVVYAEEPVSTEPAFTGKYK